MPGALARRHIFKSGPEEVRVMPKRGAQEGGILPLLREKKFDLCLPLCAFLMHFGWVLDQILEQAALAYPYIIEH